MAKFNRKTEKQTNSRLQTAAHGVIKTTGRMGDTKTFEGAPAMTRDPKSELFLLGVTNMVSEDTFYETGDTRDARFKELVHTVTALDPEWMFNYLKWLRSSANMRTASLVGAAEAVASRLGGKGIPYEVNGRDFNRSVIDAVMQRADEPGEFLGYWFANYGRRLPQPVKRGVADAVVRLYGEYSYQKYDSAKRGVRMADVIEMTHPKASGPLQSKLFKHMIDARHGRDIEPGWFLDVGLTMLHANGIIRELTQRGDTSALLDQVSVKAAGMTWEDVLSLGGKAKIDKAKLWHSVIPSMGYMALLRNLRNFDEAEIDREYVKYVSARLADPNQVARSRQLPYRFLSAYTALSSDRWREPLREALDLSLHNVPVMPGKTLVLADTSASMSSGGYSARSVMTPAMSAALFGVALAAKGEDVEFAGFAGGGWDSKVTFTHDVRKGASVLRETERFIKRIGEVGHGTEIMGAVKERFKDHDRVVILTDLQTFGGYYADGIDRIVPQEIPIYAFNLQGYKPTPLDTSKGRRYEMGGLTDATFRTIPQIEAGLNATWPWED